MLTEYPNTASWSDCARGELIDHFEGRIVIVSNTVQFDPKVRPDNRPLGSVPPVGLIEGLRGVLRQSWGWIKAPFALVVLLALWVAWVSWRIYHGEEK